MRIVEKTFDRIDDTEKIQNVEVSDVVYELLMTNKRMGAVESVALKISLLADIIIPLFEGNEKALINLCSVVSSESNDKIYTLEKK